MEFEMNLEQTLNEITGKLYGKNIGACTDAQLYTGVLQLTKEKILPPLQETRRYIIFPWSS